ncbi:hypothetical protein [Paraburkholderia fynbosensis]|uniref:hypothetical protein n=1 Tax=Paraburkholderia fynbosensis TaxID=1200993 RepID=UPI001581E3B2|nr:hypothetical protein [Paraburkholderia fynbosensis]
MSSKTKSVAADCRIFVPLIPLPLRRHVPDALAKLDQRGNADFLPKAVEDGGWPNCFASGAA